MTKIGLLTVDDPRARSATVLLNGSDVTNRCFVADDRYGWVGLYKLNAQGNKYVEPIQNNIAREIQHGDVQILFR